MKLYLTFSGHFAGALKNRVKAAAGGSCLFTDFFHELRHVVDLFDRNHVEFGTVLLGERDRQRWRMKDVLRPVIGMEDFAGHKMPPLMARPELKPA
jgi:hypothetical protein